MISTGSELQGFRSLTIHYRDGDISNSVEVCELIIDRVEMPNLPFGARRVWASLPLIIVNLFGLLEQFFPVIPVGPQRLPKSKMQISRCLLGSGGEFRSSQPTSIWISDPVHLDSRISQAVSSISSIGNHL